MYLPFLGRPGKQPSSMKNAKRVDYNKYWNPYTETMPLEKLRELSFKKVLAQIKWLYNNNSYYYQQWSKRKIKPEDIRTPRDMQKLPFMIRNLGGGGREQNDGGYDYIVLDESICTWPDQPELLAQFHQTSGFTGVNPVRMLDTLRDWEYVQEGWCLAHWAQGIRPYDVATWFASYGLFIMWAGFNALEKLGCQIYPAGGMDAKTRIQLLRKSPITVICTTPNYALYLIDVAEKMGVDLVTETNVRIITMAGEPLCSGLKEKIERGWGARAYNSYGSTESGLVWAFECAEGYPHGDLHVMEDQIYVEIINPDTLEPVEPGEVGELVITHLGRSATPVVRYRTRDLVVLSEEPCSCGRGYARFVKGILGRVQETFKIKGRIVFPIEIEDLMRSFEEVEEYQIVVKSKGQNSDVQIIVDPKPWVNVETFPQLKNMIAEKFFETFRAHPASVETVPHGTLPRFEEKAKRISISK
ncbi:phenylacetate--CoA ligase family protein [Calderihabitans maritimus]|uniref:Phenylacetate--CoA ligase n=1 Tax=Calderihabitans maritimus TaxID=1246530 RepID=A0A1Z5HWV2_9FIRM|nr:AMP-binding protein [Calderihabitans maritimus]GAW93811.1 hypothetical protein MPTA5024_05395 [Calderihabitans maritimus]